MPTKLFGELLAGWWERYLLRGSQTYAHECWRRLEREVLPRLGDKPPKKIMPPMILRILRRIETRGTLASGAVKGVWCTKRRERPGILSENGISHRRTAH